MRAAHYPRPHDDKLLGALRERVAPHWEIEADESRHDFSVLIDGHPSDDYIAQQPELKAVIIPFAGVPPATLEVMRRHPNLALYNLHHNAPETAELALTLLLAAAKSLVPVDQMLRRGDWSPRYDPSHSIRLAGRTAAVVGMGHVGRRIVAGCAALGMKVVGIRRQREPDDPPEVHGFEDLAAALRGTDVLILAAPLTKETQGLIGRAELALLNPNGIVVNIARAGLLDEAALYDALASRRLFGAGLDVWYQYPEVGASPGSKQDAKMPPTALGTWPSQLPFHELDNVVMSPHRGGASLDVAQARIEAIAETLSSLVELGQAPNGVDLNRGY